MAGGSVINILIRATDNYSKEFNKASSGMKKMSGDAKNTTKSFGGLNNASVLLKGALVAVAVAASALALKLGSDCVKSAVKFQNAMMGLETVATKFGVSTDAAKKAAQDLASDGLMTVAEAGEGLKNLISTGFSLPEAIELMKGFKDSAAFNRQGTLEFGQAIVGATQGIKNMNSMMVDNAGITKNLSQIMKERGFTMQDVTDEVKGAAARQAMYNGLLKETAVFEGDAEKSAKSFGGQMDRLKTNFEKIKIQIGNAMLPALTDLLDIIKENEDVLKALATTLAFVTKVGMRVFVFGVASANFVIGGFIDMIKLAVKGVLGLKDVLTGEMGWKEFFGMMSDEQKKMNERMEARFGGILTGGLGKKAGSALADWFGIELKNVDDLTGVYDEQGRVLGNVNSVLDESVALKEKEVGLNNDLADSLTNLTMRERELMVEKAKAVRGMGTKTSGSSGSLNGMSPRQVFGQIKYELEHPVDKSQRQTTSQKMSDLFKVSKTEDFAAHVEKYGGISGYQAYVPKLSSGGKILSDGLAFLHKGETVTPANKTNNNNFGGITINISTTGGVDAEQVSEEVALGIQRRLATG